MNIISSIVTLFQIFLHILVPLRISPLSAQPPTSGSVQQLAVVATTVSGEPAPQVFKTSEGVSPGDLVNLYGANLGSQTIIAIDNASVPVLNTDPGGDFVTIRIPTWLPPGIFQVQLQNDILTTPLRIVLNEPQANWISETNVYPGSVVTLFGRNLDGQQFGASLDTHIRLGGQVITPHSVNPYAVTFTIPQGTVPGSYDLSVQNMSGGDWVTLSTGSLTVLASQGSDPLGLGVAWAHDYNWNTTSSVMAYGAKGDGIADDTLAIQSAIDAVSAGGGGVVIFPSGTYLYTSIRLKYGVVLMGMDKNTSILEYDGSGGESTKAAITYANNNDPGLIGFANLTLTYNATALTKGLDMVYIGAYIGGIFKEYDDPNFTMSRIFFYNNNITGPASTTLIHEGIHVGVMTDTLALDNTFTGFGMNYQDFTTSNVTIKNNTFMVSAVLAVFTLGSEVDVENNSVTVTTPRGYQGHGFFEDPSSGYPVNHIYYFNNTAETQGSGGDGEAFATDGSPSFLTGQVTSANGTSLSMNIDCYQTNPSINGFIIPKFWDSQWYMAIIDGKGLGQIRTITSNSSDNTSFTVDHPWDIQPDATSRIEVGNFDNDMVLYDNKVADSSEGLQAYGYDTVWNDNTITSAPSSIIDDDWNTPGSIRCARPIYFVDISDNQFQDSGVHLPTSPYIDLLSLFANRSYESSSASFPCRTNILSYGVEIRHNDFSGSNTPGQIGINFRNDLGFKNPALTDYLATTVTQLGPLIDQNTFSGLTTDIKFSGGNTIAYATELSPKNQSTGLNILTLGSVGSTIMSWSASISPPAISHIMLSSPSDTTESISWTTNQAANSEVDYGLSSEMYTASSSLSSLQTSHTVTLTGLQANTLYHFQIRSQSEAGMVADSSDGSFKTLPSPSLPPPFAIANIAIAEITQTSVRITVVTNASSSIVIGYSSADSGYTTQPSPYLRTTYVELSGLTPATDYAFHVIATSESSGTMVSSGKYTFTTLKTPPTAAENFGGGGGGSLAPQKFYASSSQPSTLPDTTTSPPPSSAPTSSVPVAVVPQPFPRTLKLGDIGTDVALLQKTLEYIGFLSPAIKPTGYFGKATEHALLLFQGAHALAMTGALTPQSQALLNKIVDANPEMASFTSATSTIAVEPSTSISALPMSVTAATGLFSRTMTLGARGGEVSALQSFLLKDGDYPGGIVSGYYGALTEKAVQAFQSKYGIISYGSPETTGYGAVGLRTLKEINVLYQ